VTGRDEEGIGEGEDDEGALRERGREEEREDKRKGGKGNMKKKKGVRQLGRVLYPSSPSIFFTGSPHFLVALSHSPSLQLSLTPSFPHSLSLLLSLSPSLSHFTCRAESWHAGPCSRAHVMAHCTMREGEDRGEDGGEEVEEGRQKKERWRWRSKATSTRV
jgi:hypothetical protein